MPRALKAILVTIGIFLGLEVLQLVAVVIIDFATQHQDANGITYTQDAAVQVGIVTWTAPLTIASALLAAVGGIVYGVQPPKPPQPTPPEK